MIETLLPCNFGIKIKLNKIIIYLMNEFHRFLVVRKEAIRMRHPGGLANSVEPRLVWCTMIPRPKHVNPARRETYKSMYKFTEVLEDQVTVFNKFSLILYVENLNEYMHFDRAGRLTSSGKVQFWHEVDKKMRCLDKGKSDLIPKKYTSGIRKQFKN